jgi:hypothetical protein
MPKNSFVVSVDDTTALTATLVALPESLKPYINAAAFISANHIREDAAARLQRQLLPLQRNNPSETVEGILVNPDRSGWGWMVDAGNLSQPMLDRWLELGTLERGQGSGMAPRPFFFDSARLEEQAHLARVNGAIQQAIADKGLGDA